jgi:hypothetical protein
MLALNLIPGQQTLQLPTHRHYSTKRFQKIARFALWSLSALFDHLVVALSVVVSESIEHQNTFADFLLSPVHGFPCRSMGIPRTTGQTMTNTAFLALDQVSSRDGIATESHPEPPLAVRVRDESGKYSPLQSSCYCYAGRSDGASKSPCALKSYFPSPILSHIMRIFGASVIRAIDREYLHDLCDDAN